MLGYYDIFGLERKGSSNSAAILARRAILRFCNPHRSWSKSYAFRIVPTNPKVGAIADVWQPWLAC